MLIVNHCNAQSNRIGNLGAYVDSIITSMPGAGTNEYQLPTAAQLNDFGNAVLSICNGNFISAASIASGLGYQLIHFTDNTGNTTTYFYVLAKNVASTNYWGTYIFSVAPVFPNLILQAPHPKFDSNTGSEAYYVFKNSGARAFCMSGTHRCNQSILSNCSGTTDACGATGPFRISDVAHNENSVFYRVTQTLNSFINGAEFIQLHGFAKQPTDPYIIMSNGTHFTPPNDYVVQIKNQLQLIDNSLTFKIAHLDTTWTKLNGISNTEGRLVNQSSDVCIADATHCTGRFIHIEQEFSKLRQNQNGWNKILQAVTNVFSQTPLPLELIDFKTRCDKEQVFISCSASLQNCSSLAIQKSSDGRNFIDLELFNTINMGNGNHQFTTSDNVVNGFTKYYRIKQTDNNGEITFSKVINKTCFSNLFVCFYDDATQQIKVQFSQLIRNGHVDLYNCNGKNVFSYDFFMKGSAQINTSELSNGIYFLRVNSDEFSDGKKIQILK